MQVEGGLQIGELITLAQWQENPAVSLTAFQEALKASIAQSGETILNEQVGLESVTASARVANATSNLAVRYTLGLLCDTQLDQASDNTDSLEVLVSTLAQALSRGLRNSSTFVTTFLDVMNSSGIQLNDTGSTHILPILPHGVQLMSPEVTAVSVDYVIRTFG